MDTGSWEDDYDPESEDEYVPYATVVADWSQEESSEGPTQPTSQKKGSRKPTDKKMEDAQVQRQKDGMASCIALIHILIFLRLHHQCLKIQTPSSS